jgi:zinc/manganese transport system substrate-binding protein
MIRLQQLRFGYDGRAHVRRGLVVAALAALVSLPLARADPIKVVAAESVYGDIAAQIGGAHVTVTSILTSPSQDPHEFEASAATARSIATARLVIYNGADYDPWAARLLSASPSPARESIEVAKLAHKHPGDNPHLWYEPAAVSALGGVLAARLTELDPERGADYARGLADFETAMRALNERIAALRAKYAGTAVTATEPVFDYMADALGLVMRNGRFQLAVMNGTEPGAASIAAFENDLRTRTVKVLLYNRQTSQALAERMRSLAGAVGVPVVAITETEPPGQSYQEWMLGQLDALERALGGR